MKKHCLVDLIACNLFKLVSFLLKPLPAEWVYFIGRRIGDCMYAFDPKHRAIAYANIRRAINGSSVSCVRKTTVKFYRNLGQNIIELFIIPRINEQYIRKYINVIDFDRIAEGRKRGRGIIFLVMHAGSWELANIVSARSGYPYAVIVRGQEFPRLNKLLNQLRREAGARIIDREEGLSGLIRALKDNQAVAMTIDQGGKDGELVNFFGKNASMAQGAIKLGLKYDSVLIPVFCQRENGPRAKIILHEPLMLKRYPSEQETVQHNLREAVGLFESFIKENPAEYLWTYKVWKYSDQRNILILSDAKAGHLRQAESLAGTVAGYLKDKGLKVSIETVEVKLKNRFSKVGLLFSSFFAGKYACQGCSWCLKSFLEAGTYNKIISVNPDIIISAGSGVAPVNYVVSRECLAKSLVIMKPQFLSPGKFNLLVIPKHDNPPVRKNVCIINGALNLINETYLKDQAEKLRARIAHHLSGKVIGLLMGGDTKNFAITENMINELIRQIKSACENLDADILVTTSRRSSPKIEKLLKDAFGDYPRCRLLIVANENNIPEAVGGILGLSTFLVTSPESISMLSEAASSGKVTFVFSACGLSRKHANFLDSLTRNNFVKAVRVSDIASHIIDAAENNAKMAVLDNNEKVIRSLGKVL